MMIFNSLIAANDYNFGAVQMTEEPLRFLADKHKSIDLATAGTFLQKVCKFFLYLKPFCQKNPISFGFKVIYELVSWRKVTQDLICTCKKKLFHITTRPQIQVQKKVNERTEFVPWLPTAVDFWSLPCQSRGLWKHVHTKSKAAVGLSLKKKKQTYIKARVERVLIYSARPL